MTITDEELRQRMAAYATDIKEALELCSEALNHARRFKVPARDTDSYEIASKLDRLLWNLR